MDAEWTASPDASVSGDCCAEREFTDLARESSSLAFRVAWSVVRDRADAEEIAQEALLRAYRHFPELRKRERFRAWMVRVTWRLALDRIRAKRRRVRRELDIGQQAIAAAGSAKSREFHFALAEEIERLPRKLRKVMILAAVQGYDVREVARLLDVPEGTVKSRLFLARKRLIERLEWVAEDTERR
ncbi:MAG: RNA polymerase sigma factor [Acidobacteriota bacterium]|nr:RNA polymerase sigma factor [Acidobacteriota bacterium]